jgi:hypothetical protein
MIRLAIALLLLATPALAQPRRAAARPEPDASLLQRTPALTLAAPPQPLTAPLAIGGAGWGPFTRLCVTRHLIQPDGKEVLETEPSCFTVTSARESGATWQLEMLTDPLRGGQRVAFAATRNAAGAVGNVTITPPEGAAAPPPAMLARLQAVFRVMLEAHGLRAITIAPNTPFLLPLQIAEADPDTTAEGGGFTCTPNGTATLRARTVLVATCRTTARTDLGSEAIGRVDLAGHFAIDTETGLVVQHRYSSFLFMEKNPKNAMPDLRWRGISRQDLQ